MKIIFATNNKHKLEEVRHLFSDSKNIEIISLADAGIECEIPETHETLEENALEKAQFIYQKTGMNCFADDTGLEIEALDGRPGVYSARYAGENCSFEDNVNKVVTEMQGLSNRKAAFRTIAALIIDGKEYLFEGKVSGKIIEEGAGTKGFGYDPIFLPDGYSDTFAQMDLTIKNKISHRANAFNKLHDFMVANFK